MSAITEEALSKFGLSLLVTRPILIVMAPEAYWRRYLENPSTGSWLPELLRIIEGLKVQLKLEVHMVALKGVKLEMGLGGKHPVLHGNCELASVEQISGAF